MQTLNTEISPENTVLFVVDPLFDFYCKDGAFGKTFGEKELQQIRQTIVRLSEVVEALRGRVHLVLVRSRYSYNQFDVPNLEPLCVDGPGQGWRSESVIPEEWFDEVIVKNDNSMLESPDDVPGLLSRFRNRIIAGVTGTGCVYKSAGAVLDLATEGDDDPDHRIVVLVRDLIGSRVSQQDLQESRLRELEQRDPDHVALVDTLEDIGLPVVANP